MKHKSVIHSRDHHSPYLSSLSIIIKAIVIQALPRSGPINKAHNTSNSDNGNVYSRFNPGSGNRPLK